MAKKIMRAQVQRRNRIFYIAYAILVLALGLILVVGRHFFDDVLARYEAQLPSTRADELIASLNAGDTDEVRSALMASDTFGDVRAAFDAYQSAMEAPARWTPIPTTDQSISKYRLISGDTHFLSLTLARTAEAGRPSPWAVQEATLTESIALAYAEKNASEFADATLRALAEGDYAAIYPCLPSNACEQDTLAHFESYMQSYLPAGEALHWNETLNGTRRTYEVTCGSDVPFLTFTTAYDNADGTMNWRVATAALDETVQTGYQQALPDFYALTFRDDLAQARADRLYALSLESGYPDCDPEAFAAFLSRITEGCTLTCEAYPTEDDNLRRYRVVEQGETFATFSLRSTATAQGYRWTAEQLQIAAWQPFDGTLIAPHDATVYVGDEALTADDVIEVRPPEGVDARVAAACPDYGTQKVYALQDTFALPEIRVIDPKGRECPLEKNASDQYKYTARICDDDDLLHDQYDEGVYTVVRNFSYFTTNDVYLSTMERYVDKTSDAYDWLVNYDGLWVKKHNAANNKLTNYVSDHYIQYTDTLFSCEVHYDYTLRYTYAGKVTYPTAYRFYFEKINGNWKLYSFVSIE